MQKYIFLALCSLISINAAELSQRQPREWMAKEYAQLNQPNRDRFLHWMRECKIPIEDQAIISFGCGTGDIEAELAKKAYRVHGIDASKNMIEYAQAQHKSIQNLSFDHRFAEDLTFEVPLYNLAIAASCFQWLEDKPKALQAICQSLDSGGLFFANIETTTNPEHFGLTVFEEMKQDVPIIGSILALLPNPTGSSRPTEQELRELFTSAGLRILSSKIEPYDCTMTPEEWRKHQLPLLLSTPGAQMLINYVSESWLGERATAAAFWCITMSEKEKAQHNAPFFPECQHELVQKIRNNDFCRYLFNNFLNRCLKKMQNNDNGTYTWRYETTLIFAQRFR